MSNSAISSGPLTTDTLLFNGASYLKSVVVGAAANVNIYDNTSGTGKIIFSYNNATGTLPVFVDFSHMVQSKNGLFVNVVAGTVFVYYG